NTTGRGKGLGKGSSKRHRRVLRETIQGISKRSIRRLARCAGVIRISGLVYEEIRAVLKVFVGSLVLDAYMYTQLAHRKAITTRDVIHALKRQGGILYGFE
ncbi:hypothetical protein F444_13697, partial [Phytophthora nicotianae P1976]